MKSEPFNHMNAKPNEHEIGPGVFVSFIPDDVLDISSDGWSPDMTFLAGRSVSDFGTWRDPLIPFSFEGLPAYSGVDNEGRTFMVIEAEEDASRPATRTTLH